MATCKEINEEGKGRETRMSTSSQVSVIEVSDDDLPMDMHRSMKRSVSELEEDDKVRDMVNKDIPFQKRLTAYGEYVKGLDEVIKKRKVEILLRRPQTLEQTERRVEHQNEDWGNHTTDVLEACHGEVVKITSFLRTGGDPFGNESELVKTDTNSCFGCGYHDESYQPPPLLDAKLLLGFLEGVGQERQANFYWGVPGAPEGVETDMGVMVITGGSDLRTGKKHNLAIVAGSDIIKEIFKSIAHCITSDPGPIGLYRLANEINLSPCYRPVCSLFTTGNLEQVYKDIKKIGLYYPKIISDKYSWWVAKIIWGEGFPERILQRMMPYSMNPAQSN